MGGDSRFRPGGLSRLGGVERRPPEGAHVRLRVWREGAPHLARRPYRWRSLPMRSAGLVGI